MTLYAETVTWFKSLGEDAERKATFERHVLAGCKYEETEAAVRRGGYDSDTSKALLFVPVPLAADLMDGDEPLIAVGDRVVRGSLLGSDDKYTRRVTGVNVCLSQGHLHHLEVTCA